MRTLGPGERTAKRTDENANERPLNKEPADQIKKRRTHRRWNGAVLRAQRGQTPAVTFMNQGCQFPSGVSFWLHCSSWNFTGRVWEMWWWEAGVGLHPSPLLSYSGAVIASKCFSEKMAIKRHILLLLLFCLSRSFCPRQRRNLPRRPTSVNQSDQRDALTVFLSRRLAVKTAFVELHFEGVLLWGPAFIAMGTWRLYSPLTSALENF